MKYAHYIVILIGIILFSCKKYQNDPFYSTYTVESRLTKGGIWSCNKIKRADGKEYLLKEYQYYFDFSSNNEALLSFGKLYYVSTGMMLNVLPEFSSKTNWSFEEKKSILNFNGKWKVKKLTVNNMELIDEMWNTYYFNKISDEQNSEFVPLDNNIKGIPIHGIHSKITTLKHFLNCEQITEISGTSTVSPLEIITGLSKNAIGGNTFGGSASTSGSYNFQYYFTKAGVTTFWLKGGFSYLSEIKINNQPCSFKVTESIGPWLKIIIEIPSSGNKQFSIPTSGIISGVEYNVVDGIDEIRFWEYE